MNFDDVKIDTFYKEMTDTGEYDYKEHCLWGTDGYTEQFPKNQIIL